MSGMTLWDVAIKKQRVDEQWVNVYVINAPNVGAAVAVGQEIAILERAVHLVSVSFISVTAEPRTLPPGGGTVLALTGTGSVAVSTEELPLFNVVRVWLRPATGKPSQKYLRLPLRENDTTAMAVHATTAAAIDTSYAQQLLTIPELVDPQGQAFVSAGVAPLIGNRQLSWKRRARPNEKRGWVAK